jgi:hypothetical protein
MMSIGYGWLLSKGFYFIFATIFELFLEMCVKVDVDTATDSSFSKSWGKWNFDVKNTYILSHN